MILSTGVCVPVSVCPCAAVRAPEDLPLRPGSVRVTDKTRLIARHFFFSTVVYSSSCGADLLHIRQTRKAHETRGEHVEAPRERLDLQTRTMNACLAYAVLGTCLSTRGEVENLPAGKEQAQTQTYVFTETRMRVSICICSQICTCLPMKAQICRTSSPSKKSKGSCQARARHTFLARSSKREKGHEEICLCTQVGRNACMQQEYT